MLIGRILAELLLGSMFWTGTIGGGPTTAQVESDCNCGPCICVDGCPCDGCLCAPCPGQALTPNTVAVKPTTGTAPAPACCYQSQAVCCPLPAPAAHASRVHEEIVVQVEHPGFYHGKTGPAVMVLTPSAYEPAPGRYAFGKVQVVGSKPQAYQVSSQVIKRSKDGVVLELRLIANSREFYTAREKFRYEHITPVVLSGCQPEPVCAQVIVRSPRSQPTQVSNTIKSMPQECVPLPVLRSGFPIPPMATPVAHVLPAPTPIPDMKPNSYQPPVLSANVYTQPVPPSSGWSMAMPVYSGPAPALPVSPIARWNPVPPPVPVPPPLPCMMPEPTPVAPTTVPYSLPVQAYTQVMLPPPMPVPHRALVRVVYEAGKPRLSIQNGAMTTQCAQMKLETGAVGSLKIAAGKNLVHLTGEKWKAQAEKVELGEDGRVVLVGHVKLSSEKLGVGASVKAQRMAIQVRSGKFETVVDQK